MEMAWRFPHDSAENQYSKNLIPIKKLIIKIKSEWSHRWTVDSKNMSAKHFYDCFTILHVYKEWVQKKVDLCTVTA